MLVNYADLGAGSHAWPKAALDHLDRYVSGGGGLIAYHAAVAAFEQSPVWNKMIGLGWRKASFGTALAYDSSDQLVRLDPGKGDDAGHGDVIPLPCATQRRITRSCTDSPPTSPMPPMNCITACGGRRRTSRFWPPGYSPITNLNEPLAWTVGYGKGRTFVTVLGHDLVAVQSPDFQISPRAGANGRRRAR